MKTRLVATLLALVCATSASAQTFDAAKLDLLFDRLLENNKGMGGLKLISKKSLTQMQTMRDGEGMGP